MAPPEDAQRHPAGRIVVIGATGYTGRLVARELAAGPADGPRVLLTGRTRGRLDGLVAAVGGGQSSGASSAATARLDSAVVDVTEPESLGRAIRPGDAVINCAGPFAELGEPVVAACVAASASYVDTTGEQAWMRAMRARYHDRAVAAGSAVVNGMAFEWALGDCAAARLAPFRSLDVIYAWGGSASSRGTRRTALRIMGSRAWQLEAGRWRLRPAGSARRRFRFGSGRLLSAVAFGAGEVVTVPRWSEPETVRGWLVMGGAMSLTARVLSPALPLLVPLLRPFLEPLATRSADPTPEERKASRFTIRLEAEGPAGERRALEVRGTDPYGLTAAIAVAGARRALEPDAPAGVLAPSQLVDPASLLAGLAPRGVEVVPEP